MIFLVLSFVFSGLVELNAREFKVDIYKQSELEIHGTTNVNSFTFTYDQNYLQDNMRVKVENRPDRISLDNAILKLRVKGFDSGNSVMNKDLYNLLNAETFPYVQIDFQSAIPLTKGQSLDKLSVNAKVNLGGKSHYEVIDVRAVNGSDNFHYVGSTTLNLSDYSITPPVKFMGLVRVQEKLKIVFNLQFQANQNS